MYQKSLYKIPFPFFRKTPLKKTPLSFSPDPFSPSFSFYFQISNFHLVHDKLRQILPRHWHFHDPMLHDISFKNWHRDAIAMPQIQDHRSGFPGRIQGQQMLHRQIEVREVEGFENQLYEVLPETK